MQIYCKQKLIWGKKRGGDRTYFGDNEKAETIWEKWRSFYWRGEWGNKKYLRETGKQKIFVERGKRNIFEERRKQNLFGGEEKSLFGGKGGDIFQILFIVI